MPDPRAAVQPAGDELPEFVASANGHRQWLREAAQRLDDQRAREARPIARDRDTRLIDCRHRLERELAVESLPTPATGIWSRSTRSPPTGIPVLIPPDSSRRSKPRPGGTGGAMTSCAPSWPPNTAHALRQRKQLIEPISGNTKHNRRFGRFHRRGRSAARTEWRLIAAMHNLCKLYQHFTAGRHLTMAASLQPACPPERSGWPDLCDNLA